MPFNHESIRHSVGEYVRDQAHTNGIESFWSMLKRAHKGVYHNFSVKHLQRYVDEFAFSAMWTSSRAVTASASLTRWIKWE